MQTVTVLKDKRIVLGVTGSVAAYKAVDLASKLTQAGAQVEAILTEGAEQFVSPLSFSSVTGQRAYTTADLWGGDAHVLHIGLGEHADLLLIAPCTADTLARLAQGRSDNLLSLTALATRGSVLVAPAMDGGMWQHPATQANVATLRQRGVFFAGPAEGRMASGLVGPGRLLEPLDILGHARLLLGRQGVLADKHIVVTAGGTREPIDPVRYISNHSSGKQGVAIAQAALDAGATVTLITGPTVIVPTPVGAQHLEVGSASIMREAVLDSTSESDALIMAAAVADFRPATMSEQKIKRQQTPDLTIPLVPNPDILLDVAERKAETGYPRVVVGFAAETQDLLANARDKLTRKRLDLMVANDVTAQDAGFGVDTNRVTLIFATGEQRSLPLMTKVEVAEAIVAELAALLTPA